MRSAIVFSNMFGGGSWQFWFAAAPATSALMPFISSFNLGNGQGFSVKEMIAAAEKATGKKIAAEIGARRAGDPAQLIASSDKVRRILGWQPHFTDVEEIIAMAWKWQEKHPAGDGE